LGISLLLADRLDKDLVLGSHDLMEGEFKLANKIMFIPGFEVLEIINIVNNYFKKLLLLKFIWHIEALHPLGVEVIHDDFSHSNHLPHIASLLI